MSILGLALPWWAKYAAGALVAVAVGVAIWRYGVSQYNEGVDDLAAKWAASEVKATAAALALSQDRQAAVNRAQAADAERDRVYALKTAPIKVEVKDYGKSPAAVARCVDAAGVRIGAKVIAAANAATAATD